MDCFVCFYPEEIIFKKLIVFNSFKGDRVESQIVFHSTKVFFVFLIKKKKKL